jgi:hypothetical protein
MANTKISAFTSGAPAQSGDEFVIARSGANFKLAGSDIKTLVVGAGDVSVASTKTLTASNTLTLAGTDGTTMTFPSTSATIARTDAANTFTGGQTISGGTLNGTVLDITQTWGGTGAYTGLKYNVTDSGPSNSASLLMDLQVGGTSRFQVGKNSRISAGTGELTIEAFTVSGRYGDFAIGSSGIGVDSPGLFYFTNTANNATFGFADTFISRRGAANLRLGAADAAAPVAQFLSVQGGSGTNIAGQPFTIEASRSTGTAAGGSILFNISPAGGSSGTAVNTPVIFGEMTSTRRFSLYNTFTSATNFERANIFWDSNVLKVGTEKGSAGGTARALEIQTDGTTRLTIAATTGNVTTTGSVTTEAPTGGTAAAWRLGTVASVTPTLQNRTIEVDIGGTIYYISAKTTND